MTDENIYPKRFHIDRQWRAGENRSGLFALTPQWVATWKLAFLRRYRGCRPIQWTVADQQDTIRKRRVELSDPGTEHRVFGYNTVQLSKTFLVARRITPATFPIRLLILLTLIAFGLTRSAIGTRLDSFLLDEYYHITAGVSYVRLGDYRLNPEHLRW
jgi:hypothetical protein